MSSPIILNVNDHAANLYMVSRMLRGADYTVVEASTGQQALDIVHAQPVSLVVLDIQLPDISGLEVLGTIRRHHGTVLMLTGYGEVETAVEAMRLGAENFLTKPVDMGHLAATVEKAAEKNQLRRENVELRARLTPSLKRQIVRWSAVVALLVASVLVGKWIGGDKNVRPTVPIPVPIDSTPR